MDNTITIWDRLIHLASYHAGKSILHCDARDRVGNPSIACAHNIDMRMHDQARKDILEIIEKYKPKTIYNVDKCESPTSTTDHVLTALKNLSNQEESSIVMIPTHSSVIYDLEKEGFFEKHLEFGYNKSELKLHEFINLIWKRKITNGIIQETQTQKPEESDRTRNSSKHPVLDDRQQ